MNGFVDLPSRREDTLVPANPEAEQAVLGSILIDPDAVVRIASFLKADDFYQEKNGWIYQAILNLHERHEPADSLTVSDELDRRRQLDEVGGPAYVMDLINVVPTAIHVEYYARIVEKKSALRKLIHAAGQIAQLAYEDGADPDEAGGKALTLVSEATRRATKTNTRSFGEVLDNVYKEAKENARIRAEGGMVSIPFGLKRLDEMTGGGIWPSKGNIAIIAGLPKSGKTTFAIQVATSAAKLGFKGLILSLEMQGEEVVEKTMYEATGYSPLEIRRGDILDWNAFEAAKTSLDHPNLTIDDSASLTMAELSTIVRRVDAEKGGLDFICIDYAQLVSGGGKMENRTQELSKISRGIKALAKELGIGVFLIAQLNRNYATRQDRKPMSSDLEGSSQWEKEANFIIFIHRQDDPATEEEETSATIILARSRATQTGEFQCGFDGRTSTFSDNPAPMGVPERDKWHARLMKQCAALPLTWDDWKLHQHDPYEEVLARARITFAGTGGKERDALKALMVSWKDGVDTQALANLEATVTNRSQEMLEIIAVSQRKAILQKVQRELMPALSDRRFAVFYGPSGRGKTHMARIVQAMAIQELSMPAVWLNWRAFIRDIKSTYNGAGAEHEVWRNSRAPILMLDDTDKIFNEFHIQQLYDVLDEALNLSGTPRSVILLINHTPKEYGEKLAEFGQLGNAVAQRALSRGNPVWVDFSPLPNWVPITEIPGF